MALVKGTNAYANVAEADDYFADRLDVAAWIEADATQKAQALVTAALYLENLNWVGVVVSESQALAFPRAGSYFDPRIGYAVSLPTTVPERIIKAQYELAYHFLNNDGLLDNAGGVDSLNVGTISLTNIRPASRIPETVRQLIRPLLTNADRVWWRAN